MGESETDVLSAGMESLSNMYRRARHKVSNFFDLCCVFLRWLFQHLPPLWNRILRIPGIEFLCRRARLWCARVQNLTALTWRGSRNEPSESNQSRSRYSSDEEEGIRGGPYSRAPNCEAPETLNKPPEVKVEGEFTGNEYRVDETDDFYCEYDSTWEHEPENEGPPRRKAYQTRRNRAVSLTCLQLYLLRSSFQLQCHVRSSALRSFPALIKTNCSTQPTEGAGKVCKHFVTVDFNVRF